MLARLASMLAVAMVASLTAALPAAAQANPETPVFINELHYDNAGGDAGEFVEVAGPVGTDLSGYSIVLYNGNGGAAGDPNALSGTIGESKVLAFPIAGIQNGPVDGLALVRDDSVVQLLSYGGVFFANDGPAAGLRSTDIGVSEDPAPAAGQSLQLTGSGDSYGDFTWTGPADDTPGAANTGQTLTQAAGAQPTAPPPQEPGDTRSGSGSTVFVNELHYDNAGDDAGELVEVAGPVGTDLSGYSIVLYNGNGGAASGTEALSGAIGESGVVAVEYAPNGIQNGPVDGLALVTGDTVVQFLSYGGVMFANDGPAAGLTSTDIGSARAPLRRPASRCS